MKLVKCTTSEVVKYYRRKSQLFDVLEEFANSEMMCARIENWTHKNAASCQASFIQAVKRYGFNIIVIKNRDEVYLVKGNVNVNK